MEPLSILICLDHYPPSDGGIEVVAENLARELVSNGHDVSVLTLGSETYGPYERRDGVDVYRGRRIDLTDHIGLQSSLSYDSPIKLWKLLRNVDPDIVHVEGRFFFNSVLGALSCTLPVGNTPKLVTTFQVGDIDNVGGVGGATARLYDRIVIRRLLSRSARVITVSDAVSEYVQSFGVNDDQVTVIPNGVDCDVFTPRRDSDGENIDVLFVGRLIENNGPDTFLRAISTVIDRVGETNVTVVGDGPMRRELMERADALEIGENVRFTGRIPHERVADLMASARVFCRPSLTEGLPLTTLEAMASGCPPVVTPVAGVPEIVQDGETGKLVPVGDEEAVAEAVRQLLTNPDERARMSEAARSFVLGNYDWESRAAAVTDVYRDALSDGAILGRQDQAPVARR